MNIERDKNYDEKAVKNIEKTIKNLEISLNILNENKKQDKSHENNKLDKTLDQKPIEELHKINYLRKWLNNIEALPAIIINNPSLNQTDSLNKIDLDYSLNMNNNENYNQSKIIHHKEINEETKPIFNNSVIKKIKTNNHSIDNISLYALLSKQTRD